MLFVARRPRTHSALLATVALAVLSAIFMFTAVAMTRPSVTLAATYVEKTAICNNVYLRKKPTASVPRRVTLNRGATVVSVGTVTGSKYRSTCTGTSITSTKWLKITRINGKSVLSLYGVRYLYAPKVKFKTLYVKRTASCSASLRTYASTRATRKAVIPAGTVVATQAKVSGGSWKTTCGSKTVSGNYWYRIKLVGNKSASSLYNVTYVYAAAGLFKAYTAPASTPTPTPTPNPTPTPLPGTTEGIDVSHWQGTIDWAKVKAAGKKFAFIKASESTTFVDNKYATNRSQAKANGILVGAYHFAQPSKSMDNAVAQADHFINTAKPVKGELIPVLDLEVTNSIGTTALVNWTKAFLQRIYDRTGVRAAIYVSPSFWSNKLGNSSWFADNGYTILWIAHWTTGSQPTVPAGDWGGKGWTFWQYTSSGSVNGIGGRVDLNRYNGTNFSKVLIP